MQMTSVEIFHILNSLIYVVCNEKLSKSYTECWTSCADGSFMDLYVILLTLSGLTEERGMPYLCINNCQNLLTSY